MTIMEEAAAVLKITRGDPREVARLFPLLFAHAEELEAALTSARLVAIERRNIQGEVENERDVWRAKAIEERAHRIYPFNMPQWENLPDNDFETGVFGGKERRNGKK